MTSPLTLIRIDEDLLSVEVLYCTNKSNSLVGTIKTNLVAIMLPFHVIVSNLKLMSSPIGRNGYSRALIFSVGNLHLNAKKMIYEDE